jgi:hypothetical protein
MFLQDGSPSGNHGILVKHHRYEDNYITISAVSASRTPVKQTSLFQYFQPSPKKTTDTPASDPDSDVTPSSSIEVINPLATDTEEKTANDDNNEYDYNDDFFGIKEANPDDDWPPPAKKSKF